MEPDPATASHISPDMESESAAMSENIVTSPDALVLEDSSGNSEASDNISQTSLESRDSKSSGSFSSQLPPEIGSNADAIGILREHAPLLNLLSLIPRKAQKGLMLMCDLLLTCIDVSPEHIALGTNIGLVFLYNRKKYQLERLKCHVSAFYGICILKRSIKSTDGREDVYRSCQQSSNLISVQSINLELWSEMASGVMSCEDYNHGTVYNLGVRQCHNHYYKL